MRISAIFRQITLTFVRPDESKHRKRFWCYRVTKLEISLFELRIKKSNFLKEPNNYSATILKGCIFFKLFSKKKYFNLAHPVNTDNVPACSVQNTS